MSWTNNQWFGTGFGPSDRPRIAAAAAALGRASAVDCSTLRASTSATSNKRSGRSYRDDASYEILQQRRESIYPSGVKKTSLLMVLVELAVLAGSVAPAPTRYPNDVGHPHTYSKPRGADTSPRGPVPLSRCAKGLPQAAHASQTPPADLESAGQATLRDAAKLWVSSTSNLYEKRRQAAAPRVVSVRAAAGGQGSSLPTTRRFRAPRGAPACRPGAELFWEPGAARR